MYIHHYVYSTIVGNVDLNHLWLFLSISVTHFNYPFLPYRIHSLMQSLSPSPLAFPITFLPHHHFLILPPSHYLHSIYPNQRPMTILSILHYITPTLSLSPYPSLMIANILTRWIFNRIKRKPIYPFNIWVISYSPYLIIIITSRLSLGIACAPAYPHARGMLSITPRLTVLQACPRVRMCIWTQAPAARLYPLTKMGRTTHG